MRALKAQSETKRKELVLGQRQWIRGVINCATDVNCLTAQYQDQLQKLKKASQTTIFSPAPAPQVSRASTAPTRVRRGRGLQ